MFELVYCRPLLDESVGWFQQKKGTFLQNNGGHASACRGSASAQSARVEPDDDVVVLKIKNEKFKKIVALLHFLKSILFRRMAKP